MFSQNRNLHLIKFLSVLLLLLAVAPFAFADGNEELVIIIPGPINDNFANAEALALNTTYTTLGGLHFTTTEATEISDADLNTGCNAMRRTVWYTFTSTFDGNIALSTQGSYIERSDIEYSQDTRMAVYTGSTLANLVEVTCNTAESGVLAEITDLNVSTGTTYYVRIGVAVSTDPNVSGGFYKLTTVVKDAFDYAPVLLFNGGFDAAIGSVFGGWTVKNAFNGDGIESGEFKFYGGLFETTKIVQKATWVSAIMKARVDHLLEMNVDVDTVSGTPNLKIVLMVQYNDGTPSSKSVLKLTEAFDGQADLGVFFDSPNVSKVKVVIGNKAGAGSITVDNVELDYDGGLFRAEAAPVAPLALPLPQY